MLTRLRSYLGSRFWSRTFSEGGLRTWMHEEVVREYINESVTGSPNVWPIEWLRSRVSSPFAAAVSIGCGEGALERDLLSKGMCRSVLGIDLSTEALRLAEAKAREQGLAGVRYEQGDMNALDLPEGAFDAAFFHQSLHHAEKLDSCLAATAASLRPGALVYLDEYVGPSRGEWSFKLIEAASELYARLPVSVRRSRRLELPVDWRDPTEAIRSSEILDAVNRHFQVIERHDYGGNFLAVIHPHLRLEPLPAAERAALLRSIIDAERAHLAAGNPSYYAVMISAAKTPSGAAKPKQDASPRAGGGDSRRDRTPRRGSRGPSLSRQGCRPPRTLIRPLEVTMLRIRRTLSALLLALSAIPAAAAPLQITGRILHPPKDAQVELRPWSVEHAEALRRMKGEAVPPLASAKPRADGSFAVKLPDTGFYSVVVRAPGHLAMEGFVAFVVDDFELAPVELPPASPLEVKAVGADGQPLAGVMIQAVPAKPESGDWRAADRSAVTDAEGRAAFHRAEGEALRLVVTTPGRYSTASTDPTGASQTVRFPGQNTRTVELRRPDGKPAAGALVRLARRGWPYGLTGEDGRIPLPVPLKDEIGLFAEDSRGLRIEMVMTVEAGESTDVHVVGLRAPTAAAGRVLEETSREPIAGALVWNGGTSWTRTGSEGSFELRAPSGDRGRVEATAPGHTRASSRWQRDAVAPITFLLGPSANLTGQVVDEASRPVEGAKVETLTNPADYRMARTEERRSWSGADGRFTLRQLPAGRVHKVMASKEGFAPANRLADPTAPVRLVLRHGTVAAGRVVDDQGRPVEGAELILRLEEQDPMPRPALRFRAVSDAKGRFQLANVSAGRFDLRVTRPGSVETDVRGIVIPEGEARADLGEITLLPGAAIEGIAVDERDRPVQGAEIELAPFGPDFDARLFFREPIQSGSDGRFRIADLPRGTRVVLKARHPDLAPAEMAGVEAPTAEPVRLRLTRPRSLEGRVRDRHGEPVAGARLHFSEAAGTPLGGGWAQQPAQATSDEEGRFVLSGFKPGTAYVTATASGYRTRSAQPVEIPEEGQAPPLEITLEPGTFLEGTVRDSRGEPVPDARVHVQGMEAIGIGFEMVVPADDQGRFEVADLEPGPFRVQASSRGGPSARAELEVRPGRNQLDLALSEGTEISGRIVDGQGAPVPGASLSLRSVPKEGEMPMAALGEIQAVSTGDGSFAFQGISDGEYRLTGTRQGYAPATLPRVQVDGAPVSGLELRLGPGAVIRGRLLGLDPADVSRVRVMAHSPDQEIHLFGAVDPPGTYRIQDVPPGAWDLLAHFNSPDAVRARVEVSPGEQEVVQDLELPSGFTLTGRVLLDRSPLPRAKVFVSRNDPERPGGGHGETAYDGTFRMERLAAGSYVLRVLGATGMLHGEALEISGDRDVTIEIATGAVEGRLLSPEGLPVAGATVSLTGEDPRFFYLGPETSSDDQGAFAFPRVAAGTYKVMVKAEGFAPAESRVVVTPGGTVRVDLLLQN